MTKTAELNEPIHGGLRLKIGEYIKSIREKKGLSQDNLASIMNINRSTVSKIENGKFAISVDYLEKFSFYLDFDVRIFGKER